MENLKVDKWLSKYLKLKTYVEKTKSLPKPNDSEAKSIRLWIEKQRNAYTLNKLSSIQEVLLESLPYRVWLSNTEQNKNMQWARKYNKVLDFLKNNDTYPRKKDDPELYDWIKTQRKEYKKKNFSYEKKYLLERLKDWNNK